jgi:hypothetical protein
MEYFLQTIGGCVLVLLIGLALLLIYFAFGMVTEKIFAKTIHVTRKAAIAEITSRILRDHYWFSEDYATHELIKDIAHGIATESWNVDSVRDKWRKNRSK